MNAEEQLIAARQQELIARIRAEIDEDERIAREASTPPWGEIQPLSEQDNDHVERHDPARVLRQATAHRKVLELHSAYDEAYPEWADADIPNRRCIGCGFDGQEDAVVDDVNNCPTLLALAEALGVDVT